MAVRKSSTSSKAQPAKAEAPKAEEAATEWMAPKAGFDWAAAISKTGKSLSGLCKEAGGPSAGANPSQLRRLSLGQVARVEKARAEQIAKLLGVAFTKMWGPAA
jgi:hypothetical protein